MPVESPHQSAGQRPEPGDPPWVRNALVLACSGLVGLVAVAVLAWSVTTIIARSTSSASHRSSASASSPLQTAYIDLRPGDCLQGLGDDLIIAPLPDYFNVVSCTKQHIAEVFFAGNAWPPPAPWPSVQEYPGDNKINSQAGARCDTAFRAYDGIDNSQSAFTYDYDSPDSDSWANGDRELLCIAYESTQQYPGGAPVNYSIKDSWK